MVFCVAVFKASAFGQVPLSAESTLSGQVELARLVDLSAKRLSLNLDYDAAALKATVTVRLDGGLSDQELWDLTNRLLAARGFTTVQGADAKTFSVIKLTDAPAAAAPTNPDAAKPRLAAGFQSILVRAKHRSSKDLADQLSKLGGKSAGSISPVGDSGLLLVYDLGPRIDQILTLLDLLDTPDTAAATEEIGAQNLAAPQLMNLMLQMAAKREAVSGQKTPGELIAAADGTSILIVAPAGTMSTWKDMARTLDRREPVETATYTPRHFAPKDVARLIEQTIRDLGPGGASVGVSGNTGGTAIGSSRGATATTAGNTTSLSASDDRWRLVVDDLTGSLLITATPRQHEAIRDLMYRLDDVPVAARRPMRTFTVKNRPVDEIVAIIDQLVQSGAVQSSWSDATSSDARGGSPAASVATSGTRSDPLKTSRSGTASSPPATTDLLSLPPPPTTPATPSQAGIADLRTSTSSSTAGSATRATTFRDNNAAESPLTLTIDKGTSTIIAVGEPRILDQIEALIRSLDVRQPQVMLEVLLVTLSDGQTIDLGVELEKLEVSGDIRTRLSSLFGLGSRGSGGDRDGPSNAAGFTGVVLNPGDFSIVLRALETLNNGRSMSMPKLLVGNNESATLDSVVQQPFASVNASNTVSTTSFGGTQDAGTVVTIQPQIAEGDHLLLEYSVSLSSFLGPASSPTLPPPRQQNRVQSVATIPDGFTVVVGGIELENKSEAISQIPVLGNIPLLGEAFKSRANNKNRSRFYVFIRANVLRHGGFEDLKYISGTDASGAGVDDGWPELRPRVIR